MADDPEVWASILGWHCWRDAAGMWSGRQASTSPAVLLRGRSLDALRTAIDRANLQDPGPGDPVPVQAHSPGAFGDL